MDRPLLLSHHAGLVILSLKILSLRPRDGTGTESGAGSFSSGVSQWANNYFITFKWVGKHPILQVPGIYLGGSLIN